jgi:hypothetical protein
MLAAWHAARCLSNASHPSEEAQVSLSWKCMDEITIKYRQRISCPQCGNTTEKTASLNARRSSLYAKKKLQHTLQFDKYPQ